MSVLAASGNDLVGFLIFVIVVVVINGFRFVIQKLNESQQRPQQGRPQGDAKRWAAPQDEVRKFLQELTGQPVAEVEAEPRPKRQRKRKKQPEPKPAPEAKPDSAKPVRIQREALKRRLKPKPKVSLKQLRRPQNLQTAIILREVFGPPIALRPRGRRWPNT